MSRHQRVIHPFLATSLLAISLAAAPASADDTSCKPVVDALLAQANTPFRSLVIAQGRGGGEEIYTTTAIYRGYSGHWTKIPATPQERVAANRAVGASMSKCRQVKIETVDGQPATVYTAHSQTTSPATTTDLQIWIGRSNGLPVKLESDVEMSGRKSHISKRYVYGNVQPPPGAN